MFWGINGAIRCNLIEERNNMKTFKSISIITVCLLAPFTPSYAVSFSDALSAATTEIDKAKAANYEWRDSRKLLKKAAELNKKGDSEKAMALITKARKQGQLAANQAKLESGVSGPR